jgi:tRNA (cytidine/uridine-2'-O-)-methyltransferase
MQPQDRFSDFATGDAPLQIALIEPEIPPNTGNVARLCAATGCALHLVAPLGFSIDDRELKRAGLDYWEHVRMTLHPSLESFLTATSASRHWYFSTRASLSYAQAAFARGDILVFGKETKGLPAELLTRDPERCLRIPMRPGSVRSLNLSTAVGVAAYTALAQIGFPELQ